MPNGEDERTIEIYDNQRGFITGKTGSGKTFFARHITRTLPRLVVFDPKFTLADWGLEAWNRETRRALSEGDPIQLRVTWTERGESTVFWEDVMWEVLEAGNCLLYIDELYSLSAQGKWIPEALQRIYTQGRELGVGAIGVAQRPRFIPQFVITECEWFMRFRLQKKDDRMYMSEFMGDEVIERIPASDPHGFWYYNVGWNEPLYVDRLRIGHGDGWGEFEEAIEEEAP